MPRSFRWSALLIALVACSAAPLNSAAVKTKAKPLKVEISFPASAHDGPITGRVFFMLERADSAAANAQNGPELRLISGQEGDSPPIFGVNVDALKPGQAAVIDATTPGYPPVSLSDVPAGDYWVQALVNVYTEFHRADGRTLWLHMDQWEGQHFGRSPGNLYSEMQRVHLDPANGYDVRLSLTKVIPPVQVPPDTQWVKHIKIQSDLLTKFWGRPIYIGAVVLLPQGYDPHPNAHYPTIYREGHFSLGSPFPFSTNDAPVSAAARARLANFNLETPYEFYQSWNSADFPRMIAVTFQHPTPFYDDSYAVNSVNQGPYGDALVKELIPYLESHFRMIAKPYARVLTGGSTGGYESLAAQVFYPDFFGGTWTLYPDPIDLSHFQLANLYEGDNIDAEPGHTWLDAPRYMEREADGQPEVTMQQEGQLENVLGDHNRSGEQFEAWEAAFSQVGDDGYPKPIWDKATGKIDKSVVQYWRDHGFDLAYNVKSNWPTLGPKLQGKIHIYVGDDDSYYLNLAVYSFEAMTKTLQNPPCDCEFQYGRPMKAHGWQPTSNANLVRWMADAVVKNAPAGEDTAPWHY